MARFTFLTFYDKICLGPRILSSKLKTEGHHSNLIIFKEEVNKIILRGNNHRVNYEHYHHGFLCGSNYDIDPWTHSEVELLNSLVSDLNPDVLCISTRSFWTELGKSIVESIKNVLPNIPIVAGGWGPSLEPEKYLSYCDYVCFGEGENTILDIGTAIDKGKDFKHINNIIYRDGNGIKRNPAYEPISNLDKIPFPDFDINDTYLITNNQILKGKDFYNEKMYDIFVGRGCPLHCTYCMSGRWSMLYRQHHGFHYPKMRLRSPERCIEELEGIKCNGALFIRFKDEVFPYHRKWLDKFLTLYKNKIDLPFFAYLRPEFHAPEIVEKMYAAGLKTTGLGIQSGSDAIREKIYHRRCSNDSVLTFANLLTSKGIEYHYDVISHNPFETSQHLSETFNFLCSLPFGELKVFKLDFFPEAPIANMLKQMEPIPEEKHVHQWYSILYIMTTKNKMLRRLAILIEKYGLFRRVPYVLQIIMLPYLIEEEVRKLRAKRKYKAISMDIPGMQKRASYSLG